MHQLQEPCNIAQSDWKGAFTEEVKEELPNPIGLHVIRMDRLKCSENLETLLSSELAEYQVLTFQKLRLFQYRLSPQNHDFHILHGLFHG